MEPTTV